VTGFDFIFALFSLLLGLAMAEVFGGFARVMKVHARARAGLAKHVHVGWLVPLMAVFVLLGQLSFWMFAYAVRERVPFNFIVMLFVTATVGGYYLLSVLVWPDDFAEWPDFDRYYDQHNRVILTGNLSLALVAGGVNARYGRPPTPAQLAAWESDAALFGAIGLYGALLLNVVLIFVKRRQLNVALLATLIAMQVGGGAALLAAGVV
jgi:hypothetical protein